MESTRIDVIADVHGCRRTLERLLADQLGYRERHGSLEPPQPGRMALFLGDLIDGGPDSLGVYRLVRSMKDAGNAAVVLGNHEINALAWHTRCPDNPSTHLRPHTDKNRAQHEATLQSFANADAELNDMLEWLMEVPLWIETGGLRAIHACWHRPSLHKLQEYLSEDNTIRNQKNLAQLTRKDGSGYGAAETALKGLEMDLPNGLTFLDKHGNLRSKARIRWWLGGDTLPLKKAVLADSETIKQLPSSQVTLPREARYSSDQPPLFFGHYWLSPDPEPPPQRNNVACLDYSVGEGGPLVAYTYRGERTLQSNHFIVQEQADL